MAFPTVLLLPSCIVSVSVMFRYLGSQRYDKYTLMEQLAGLNATGLQFDDVHGYFAPLETESAGEQNCTCPRFKDECLAHAQGAHVCYSSLQQVPTASPLEFPTPAPTLVIEPTRSPTLLPGHTGSNHTSGSYSTGGSYVDDASSMPIINCDPRNALPCTCMDCCFPFAASRCSECLLFTSACESNYSEELHLTQEITRRNLLQDVDAYEDAGSYQQGSYTSGTEMRGNTGGSLSSQCNPDLAVPCTCKDCCAPYVASSPALCQSCINFTNSCHPKTLPTLAPTLAPTLLQSVAPTVVPTASPSRAPTTTGCQVCPLRLHPTGTSPIPPPCHQACSSFADVFVQLPAVNYSEALNITNAFATIPFVSVLVAETDGPSDMFEALYSIQMVILLTGINDVQLNKIEALKQAISITFNAEEAGEIEVEVGQIVVSEIRNLPQRKGVQIYVQIGSTFSAVNYLQFRLRMIQHECATSFDDQSTSDCGLLKYMNAEFQGLPIIAASINDIVLVKSSEGSEFDKSGITHMPTPTASTPVISITPTASPAGEFMKVIPTKIADLGTRGSGLKPLSIACGVIVGIFLILMFLMVFHRWKQNRRLQKKKKQQLKQTLEKKYGVPPVNDMTPSTLFGAHDVTCRKVFTPDAHEVRHLGSNQTQTSFEGDVYLRNSPAKLVSGGAARGRPRTKAELQSHSKELEGHGPIKLSDLSSTFNRYYNSPAMELRSGSGVR